LTRLLGLPGSDPAFSSSRSLAVAALTRAVFVAWVAYPHNRNRNV